MRHMASSDATYTKTTSLQLGMTNHTIKARPMGFKWNYCAQLLLCLCQSFSCSDSFQPHGLQLARLLCPWNSPGKDTGVGCHSPDSPGPGVSLQSPTQRLNLDLLHCRPILYHLLGTSFKRKLGLVLCLPQFLFFVYSSILLLGAWNSTLYRPG